MSVGHPASQMVWTPHSPCSHRFPLAKFSVVTHLVLAFTAEPLFLVALPFYQGRFLVAGFQGLRKPDKNTRTW
jgi:hypothetical protein